MKGLNNMRKRVVVQMVSDEEQSLKKSKGKTTLFAQQ